jgi:hypothetical protein
MYCISLTQEMRQVKQFQIIFIGKKKCIQSYSSILRNNQEKKEAQATFAVTIVVRLHAENELQNN